MSIFEKKNIQVTGDLRYHDTHVTLLQGKMGCKINTFQHFSSKYVCVCACVRASVCDTIIYVFSGDIFIKTQHHMNNTFVHTNLVNIEKKHIGTNIRAGLFKVINNKTNNYEGIVHSHAFCMNVISVQYLDANFPMVANILLEPICDTISTVFCKLYLHMITWLESHNRVSRPGINNYTTQCAFEHLI